MRALVLVAILIGVLVAIYIVASTRQPLGAGDVPSGAGGSPSTKSTADVLTNIAMHQDGGDGDAVRATFDHCLGVLRTRYSDVDDRLGDLISNVKTMLRKEGIEQRLVDVATDLAEIAPNPGSAKGSLGNVATGYFALRKRGNDRALAVSLATKISITMGQISESLRAEVHEEASRPQAPAEALKDTGPSDSTPQPQVVTEDPKRVTHLDLHDKWHHAIAVTVALPTAASDADRVKVCQQVLAFTFDATYGREGQVDRLKDAIITAIGEQIRDALAVDVDWKL